MEAFSRLMQISEQAGVISGFPADSRNQDLRISHLLFADDAMVFCGADLYQVGFLCCILLGFEAVSGLKINLCKSEIMPVGFIPNLEELAAVLGCKIGSLPTQYLGMPLGAKFKSKTAWEPILERSRKKLAKWKINYLSTGARLVLIKSVLSSLPTYFLSLFCAPISVLKEMERMQRNFLWGRSEGTFKHNLVKWNEVCKPIQSGGVGVRQLRLQNEALMGKWFWRFAHDNGSLWKRVIVAKYGEEKGGWISKEGSRGFGSSPWWCIRRNWFSFFSCISWQLGLGDRILFWQHKWLDIGLLSEVFPDLYAIAADKMTFVSDYTLDHGVGRVWNVQLRRSLNDWEMDRYGYLLTLLYSISEEGLEDKMIWNNAKLNVFTVKSFFNFLQGEVNDVFPWRKLWKVAIPSKVAFFSWCALKRKILTVDNLKSRGYSMVNRCSLCFQQEESIDHLFIHCEWTAELWRLILICFGFQMCFPKELNQFLLAWWGHPVGRRRRKLWNMVPLCFFWLIWKERNRRVFENVELSVLRFKSIYLSCLFSWLEGGKEIELCSFLSFIASMR